MSKNKDTASEYGALGADHSAPDQGGRPAVPAAPAGLRDRPVPEQRLQLEGGSFPPRTPLILPPPPQTKFCHFQWWVVRQK